jgi:hypothetical protein
MRKTYQIIISNTCRAKNKKSVQRFASALKLMFVEVYFPRSLPDPIFDCDESFIW